MRNISNASLLLTTCALGALFAACSSEDPATNPSTSGTPATTSPGTTMGTATSGTTATSGAASTTATSGGVTTSGGTTAGTTSSSAASVSSSASGSTTSTAASSGSAASTTGGGGGCGELAGPIDRDGAYVLEFGDIYFAVDAAGAKVIEFKRAGGANVFTTDAVDATNFGSTLWTAPQADWVWPPVPEVDSAAYTVTVDEAAGSITMVSMGTPSVGPNVTVTKVFTANLCDETIDISYSIANSGTAAASFSGWEVTRVVPGGLSFWGAEEGYLVEDEDPAKRLTAEFETDTYWFDYATDTTMEGKLFTEGVGGYLAFTQGTDLFVKAFSDVAASAHPPEHGEIEVYSNRTGGYVELEVVGGYGSIAAGAAATLEMRWYLRPMPEGATRAVGDAALKAAVLDLIAP